MTLLEGLLADGDDRRIAGALTVDFAWLTSMSPRLEGGKADQPALPPQGALGIFLGARALIRSAPGDEAWVFIEAALAAYAAAHLRGHRMYVRHSALGDALSSYPNLRIIVVEALLSARQWQDAATALRDLQKAAKPHDLLPDTFTEDALGLLAALAADHRLGPVTLPNVPSAIDWTYAMLHELVEPSRLDETREITWWAYAEYLVAALKAGRTAEAASFVDARAQAAWPIENRQHYSFNAICALSHAGRIDDAVAGIRDLVRRGYDMLWRFDRDRAEAMWWTKKMGQLDWLAPLEDVAAYQEVNARYMTPRPRSNDGPQPEPFASVEETQLSGRAGKRCALSRKLIAPGDAIYRVRPFRGGGDDAHIVAKAAFEASPLMEWYGKHVGDGYVPADFRPSAPTHAGQFFDAPAAAAFLFDLIEGAAFDVDAFIACIARPKVFPMRFEWIRGKFDYLHCPEDGPHVNDAHAGDYVNLTWIMLRCGFGPEILRRLSEIDRAIADPIFAMLATFDRGDCRKAAAAHFGLDTLPELIDIAFQSRLSLDDVLTLAGFGEDNPRFAEAMSQALATYNLHIYSNTHPQVDWYLDGLQHYALAKGARLAFFLIHTPERLPVLQTMLAEGWLVKGVGAGGYDGYENSGHTLFQAAVANRLRQAPDTLPSGSKHPGSNTMSADRPCATPANGRRPM
ncbi:hypothetical protein N7E02_21515 [Aliirhizobium terrae]|uniref:hypothetical protein n=1 Tax=Terrirhizobium terrae TaxID=2926709 RepID=UPI00257605F3|nr:hypothetical protein [Rhizobium sp. CC-CFT758]WJH39395.1 hypothetical protein N7E02_21515 [Rhizobium sp. CC-CFT758]